MIMIQTILVVNALNGVLPLQLRKKYPSAKITCAEVFSFYKDHLSRIGFEVVDWEGLKDVKFDLVIGNPPYQNPDSPRNNALWPQFVNTSFNELLADGGYLAMITPSSWMNPSGEEIKRSEEYNTGLIRKNILAKHKTIVVDVSDNLKKHFTVGSTFSYYVVKKEVTHNSLTTIKTSLGDLQLNLSEVKFLPAILTPVSFTLTKKFFSKPVIGVTNMTGEGFHSSHSKRVVKDKLPNFIYPLADTSAKYLKGIYLWSSEQHPYQNTKKVIISESGYLGPMYDPGNLGTTEHAFIIPVNSAAQGKKIVTQLNSRLYRCIMTICRWGSANHKYIIKNLPSCEGITDAEIYQYFDLNAEEISFVESMT